MFLFDFVVLPLLRGGYIANLGLLLVILILQLVMLIDRGADMTLVDKDQRNVLHLAAAAGHARCVQYLTEMGVDPTAVDKDKRTAWRLALANGHQEYVLSLAVSCDSVVILSLQC